MDSRIEQRMGLNLEEVDQVEIVARVTYTGSFYTLQPYGQWISEESHQGDPLHALLELLRTHKSFLLA
jgi:hypothetical protein